MRSLLFLIWLVAALKTEHISCELANITVLRSLNSLRTKIGRVPVLTSDYALQKDCTSYARHLATLNIRNQTLFGEAGMKILDHTDYPPSDPKNKDYTENICEITINRPADPIRYWYITGDEYYRSKERDKVEQSLVDKFTAMIWKSSTKVGIGFARKDNNNKKGRWIMVMRFIPPGNKPGEYAANILVGENEPQSATEESLSGGSQGPVVWIYIVLSIQIYLLFNWETYVSN